MSTINIRVTKKEKAELKALASSLNMSLSAYLRDAAQQEAHRVLLRPRAARPSDEQTP